MKIPKNKALELIDEKISQFQKVLAEATYETVTMKLTMRHTTVLKLY